MGGEPVTVVFDGSCPFCTRSARLAVTRGRGRIMAEPNQAPGVLERHGLSRADADRSVWAFDASGRRWHGAAAAARVLWAMGGGWRVLAAAASLPGAELAYQAVAALRSRLPAAWGDPPPYPG